MNSYRRVFLLFCLIFARFAWAETLADLDAIVTEAGSVQGFLDSPLLTQRYFEASEKYYPPGKFPRERYDLILKQMRDALVKVPELAERLYEKRDGATFSVSSEAPSFARGLNAEAFDRLVAGWKKSGPVVDDARVRALMDELAAKEEAIEAELAGVGKKKKAAMRAERYTALRADPRLKDLAAFLFRKHLETSTMARVLGSRDADLILSHLQGIKESPAALLPQGLGARVPGVLLTELKDQFPSVKDLVDAKGGAFPPVLVKSAQGNWVPADPGKKMEVTFRALPRAFHGAFKSIAVDECVGAGYKFSGVDTTPERWAVEAIHGAQNQAVEVEGKWTGFMLRVPVKTPEGTAASTDVVSPVMRRRILQKDGAGNLRTTTVFDAWLRQANKTKPADWIGHVVGDSFAINNVGAVVAVRTGPGYVLSGKSFPRESISQTDEIAAKLIGLRDRDTGPLKRYGGHMIYDAIVPEVKQVRLLVDSDETTDQALRGMIERGDTAKVEALLQSAYEAAHDHDGARNRVGDLILQLHGQNILETFAEGGRFFVKKGDEKHGDLIAFVPQLLAAGFGPRELAWARRVGGLNADDDAKFIDAVVERLDHAASFVDFLRPTWQGEGWVKQADANFAKHVDKFLALKPALDDIARAVAERSGAMPVETYRKLVDRALTLADTPQKVLIALRAPAGKLPSDVAVTLLDRLVAAMEPFRSKGLSPADADEIRKRVDELTPQVDKERRAKMPALDGFLQSLREARLGELRATISGHAATQRPHELIAAHVAEAGAAGSADWLDALATLIAEKKIIPDAETRRAIEGLGKAETKTHPHWRAIRRLELLTAPDAESFVSKIPFTWTNYGTPEKLTFRGVVDEAMDHFFTLGPTTAQRRAMLAGHRMELLSPATARRLTAEPDVSGLPADVARHRLYEHYRELTRFVLENKSWEPGNAPAPELAPEKLVVKVMEYARDLPELSSGIRYLRGNGSDAARDAVRQAIVNRLPKIVAERHSWEHLRQLKEALHYYDDIITLQNEMLKSPHYSGAENFAHVAEFAHSPPPDHYADVNRKWAKEHAEAHFFAGKFTAADLKLLQRTLWLRDDILANQRRALARLKERVAGGETIAAPEIERFLATAFDNPSDEYLAANRKLTAEALPGFWNPPADLKGPDLHRHWEIFARIAISNMGNNENSRQLLANALITAPDAASFSEVVRRSPRTDEANNAVSTVLKTQLHRFTSFKPTWAQINELKRVVPLISDVSAVQIAVLKAGMVKSAADFLHLAEPYVEAPNEAYRTELNTWILAHAKDHFFAHPHTVEDLKSLQRTAYYVNPAVELQKLANARLKARLDGGERIPPAEIARYLARPWSNAADAYVAAHSKQLLEDLPGLIGYFNLAELPLLAPVLDAPSAKKLEALLAGAPGLAVGRHVKDVAELVALLRRAGTKPVLAHSYLGMLREHPPTPEQAKELLALVGDPELWREAYVTHRLAKKDIGATEFLEWGKGAPAAFFDRHTASFLALDPTFAQCLVVAPRGLAKAAEKVTTGEELAAWSKATQGVPDREALVRGLWKGKDRVLALPGLRGSHLAELLAAIPAQETALVHDIARSALLLSTSPAELIETLASARGRIPSAAIEVVRRLARELRPAFGALGPTGGERRAYARQIGVGAWVKQCLLGFVGMGK